MLVDAQTGVIDELATGQNVRFWLDVHFLLWHFRFLQSEFSLDEAARQKFPRMLTAALLKTGITYFFINEEDVCQTPYWDNYLRKQSLPLALLPMKVRNMSEFVFWVIMTTIQTLLTPLFPRISYRLYLPHDGLIKLNWYGMIYDAVWYKHRPEFAALHDIAVKRCE